MFDYVVKLIHNVKLIFFPKKLLVCYRIIDIMKFISMSLIKFRDSLIEDQ